jgi:diacylglycerol kinase family enzyme
MDIWLFSGANLSDALRHAFGMLGGYHLRALDAHKIDFEHLVIESDQPFHIQLDGDPLGETTRAEISCRPAAIRLLVPPGAKHLLKPS